MVEELTGKVKWFSLKKGYGFIVTEEGTEYFLHHTQIVNKESLKPDMQVRFIPNETKRGLRADMVVKDL